MSAQKCCGMVYNSYCGYDLPCDKTAKVERGGKHYCTKCDPVRVAAELESRIEMIKVRTEKRRSKQRLIEEKIAQLGCGRIQWVGMGITLTLDEVDGLIKRLKESEVNP